MAGEDKEGRVRLHPLLVGEGTQLLAGLLNVILRVNHEDESVRLLEEAEPQGTSLQARGMVERERERAPRKSGEATRQTVQFLYLRSQDTPSFILMHCNQVDHSIIHTEPNTAPQPCQTR